MNISRICRRIATGLVAVWLVVAPGPADPSPEPIIYRIYLSQDLLGTRNASRAIEYGFRSALIDVDPTSLIPGRRVEFELVVRNHRANVYEAKRVYQEFVDDDGALLNLADVHSPPLIKHRDFLNDNAGLTLVPWAAGAAITRTNRDENWIFRLSVDDRIAGSTIASFAKRTRQCRDTHLLLTDNAWGHSNADALRAGLGRLGAKPASLQWIPWRADGAELWRMVGVLEAAPQDCLIFVGGGAAAKLLIDALMNLPVEKRPSLLSHWGLASGVFAAAVPYETRETLGLRFIQSCHNLFDDAPTTRLALDRLRRAADGASWATASIPAAPGFVHAYDLGLIVVEAMRSADLTGDVRNDRAALRTALEALATPIDGLIKTYAPPFATYERRGADAHEALQAGDLCMARFAEDNTIRVYRQHFEADAAQQ